MHAIKVNREKDRILGITTPDYTFFSISQKLFDDFLAAGEGLLLKVTRIDLYDESIKVYQAQDIKLVYHEGQPALGLRKP